MSFNPPLLAALSGQILKRPPFWLMRQAGRYLPEYRETRAKAGSFLKLCLNPALAAEVTLQPIRRYGMDGAILFSDILMVPYGLGQDLKFVEGEGPRLSPIRNTADLKALSLSRLQERCGPIYETVSRVRHGLPLATTLIGFAGAPWTVACYMVEGGGSKDFVHVKSWAFQDPDGFQLLMDILIPATVEYLCAQIKAGAQALQLFDSWAGILPEEAFDRWVIAPTQHIIAGIRDQYPDIPIIGFPRGASFKYLDYAQHTGVTAIGLDPTVPMSAAQHIQTHFPVQGNIDPMALVAGGGALDQAIAKVWQALGQGPFVLNLGHGILPMTPPEHVAQLAERIRRIAA